MPDSTLGVWQSVGLSLYSANTANASPNVRAPGAYIANPHPTAPASTAVIANGTMVRRTAD